MSEKAKFIGIDISDESVKKAQKVNHDEIGKRVKIIKGSAENLTFKDNSIDLITAFETVFFWKKRSRRYTVHLLMAAFLRSSIITAIRMWIGRKKFHA